LYRHGRPLTLPSPPGLGERVRERGSLSVHTISRRLICLEPTKNQISIDHA
jgi:hypothetical protein